MIKLLNSLYEHRLSALHTFDDIAASHDFAVASRDTSAFTSAGLTVIDP